MEKIDQVNYGNWISVSRIKCIVAAFEIALVLCLLSFGSFINSWPLVITLIVRTILILVLIISLTIGVYFYICRRLFSYDGRYLVQNKILDYVLAHLPLEKGSILDIGCGNGALSIKSAKKSQNIKVIGIDYWGYMWDFAKEQCETNARLEGVGDRVVFQKGDAAKLDFPDESFDGAISNFVFHEVKSQPDKRLVVREALRVVKKGGVFAFHDLFYEKIFYGDIKEFIEELKNEGISEIHLLRSSNETFIPGILRIRPMLGGIGLIYGKK
ncbi:MAG TPA: methyltransferase domain-containing protein [Desulfitobacteriaceae bacterium]|nr:methyltransferase domain-containing protein [Desulfitobacteriaceae bacterium]